MLSTNQDVNNTTQAVQPQPPVAVQDTEEQENPLLVTPPAKAAPEAPPDQRHLYAMAKIFRQPQF
jgi:hypothetical protein